MFQFTVEKIENIQSFFLSLSTKRFLPISAVQPSTIYYLLRFNYLLSLKDRSCFDLQSKRSKISNPSFSPFSRGDFYRFQPSTLPRGLVLFRFTVEKIENIQSFFLFLSMTIFADSSRPFNYLLSTTFQPSSLP